MNLPDISASNQSPDEIVEDRILARLKAAFPDDANVLQKLQGRISSGSMKLDDWRVEFEVTLGKAQQVAGEKQ